MTTVILDFAAGELKRDALRAGRIYFPDPFSMEVVTSKTGGALFKLTGLRGADLSLSGYYFECIAEQLVKPDGDFTITISPHPDDSLKVHVRPRGASVRLFDPHGCVTGFTPTEAKLLGEAILDFIRAARAEDPKSPRKAS